MANQWSGRVECRAEQVLIPTYGIGQPDKNPMFLEKRVYQGSSGVIYPHPVVDRIESERHEQPYTAIILENRYLRIMLLPQLGGRVQMALDKTNGYHFVYYNQVIKPALVGLTGPWISGGIEFNWPQHHRPSTFEQVSYWLQENPDGSRTVWFSEIERMFRTKGMVGFTLYPDTAYLELNVQLYNRTDKPQTFLWWANPAVHVNEDYQSVFPPDVHAVMDHGKRAVSDFPIATGTYYKVNYAPGTDISRYKNIPVPTSFMAYHSDYDFIGCYDHGRQAGMMHVANHHLVPGKKQWTWGNGDFGRAWDRQLTDEDGPYIELMCGAFTDNQPDFSWIQPGEEKRFQQVFLPYKGIGGATNASKEAVINLEVSEQHARIGVYVTRPREVRVELLYRAEVIFRRQGALSPENVLDETITVKAAAPDLMLRVLDTEGKEVIAFTPPPQAEKAIPNPATAAPPAQDVSSADELFLHGLHLEQYRHATYTPESYYEEAVRRDPFDSRCNNALGLLLLRRGKFLDSEVYFRQAVARITMRNPNPYDAEAYYNLGQALKMQGRYKAAFDAFYKAVWNAAWRSAAYFELARLASRRGEFEEALYLVETALVHNSNHHQARHLRVACLRKSGRLGTLQDEIAASLFRDCFNIGVLYEQSLLTGNASTFRARMGDVHTYIELALDYFHAGLFEEALAVLTAAPQSDPMVKYFAAWCYAEMGQDEDMQHTLADAAAMSPDFCFPNCVEAVPALQLAIGQNPQDGRAPYYLGNFWYAHRRYREAIGAWELACQRDPSYPTAYRNLGLAYMNKNQDTQRAREAYERAFALNPSDARVLFELDQLFKMLAISPAERWQFLSGHQAMIARRDDLMLEWISLLNMTGHYQVALDALLMHTFHPWEGGEGKVVGEYRLCLLQLARQDIAQGDYSQAVQRLEQAKVYPPNLNEGKLTGAQENDLNYTLGVACAGLKQNDAARAAFEQASRGPSEPASSLYYNDQPPEMILYQGLAHKRLQQHDTARAIFEKMIKFGQDHLADVVQMDYFAVSLPNFLVFEDDLTLRNRIHCHYMIALGYLGLGQTDASEEHLNAVKALDPNHSGAVAHRVLLDMMKTPPKEHNHESA